MGRDTACGGAQQHIQLHDRFKQGQQREADTGNRQWAAQALKQDDIAKSLAKIVFWWKNSIGQGSVPLTKRLIRTTLQIVG